MTYQIINVEFIGQITAESKESWLVNWTIAVRGRRVGWDESAVVLQKQKKTFLAHLAAISHMTKGELDELVGFAVEGASQLINTR